MTEATTDQAIHDYVALAQSRHVSLVTYGPQGMAAPVLTRIAPYSGYLLALVKGRSDIADRIRLGHELQCAACEPDGSLLTQPIAVGARVMRPAELPVVQVALGAKFGWWMRLALTVQRIRRVLPMGRVRYVGIELTVD